MIEHKEETVRPIVPEPVKKTEESKPNNKAVSLEKEHEKPAEVKPKKEKKKEAVVPEISPVHEITKEEKMPSSTVKEAKKETEPAAIKHEGMRGSLNY